jgi:hypothetical protein
MQRIAKLTFLACPNAAPVPKNQLNLAGTLVFVLKGLFNESMVDMMKTGLQ